MGITKDFLRESIQLVAMKRLPIAFEVEEGVTDNKLGESMTYKLCMQPEENNFPVYLLTFEVFELGSPKEWLIFKKQLKQVLKVQNMGNMVAAYTFVQDLLRGNALTVFNNKHATFKEQTLEIFDHCLNFMTVQMFPNKAYKLQKQYIWHMMHKPRHISVCKWIARVIKLNIYLMEFPTPTEIEARKLETEGILEVLENGIPTSLKFQIDKEGFNANSSTFKDFTKTC
eukprot:11471848-Ditylum_brightwellii.AAC.1